MEHKYASGFKSFLLGANPIIVTQIAKLVIFNNESVRSISQKLEWNQAKLILFQLKIGLHYNDLGLIKKSLKLLTHENDIGAIKIILSFVAGNLKIIFCPILKQLFD